MPMKKKYRDPFRENNQHDEAAAPAALDHVPSDFKVRELVRIEELSSTLRRRNGGRFGRHLRQRCAS